MLHTQFQALSILQHRGLWIHIRSSLVIKSICIYSVSTSEHMDSSKEEAHAPWSSRGWKHQSWFIILRSFTVLHSSNFCEKGLDVLLLQHTSSRFRTTHGLQVFFCFHHKTKLFFFFCFVLFCITFIWLDDLLYSSCVFSKWIRNVKRGRYLLFGRTRSTLATIHTGTRNAQ